MKVRGAVDCPLKLLSINTVKKLTINDARFEGKLSYARSFDNSVLAIMYYSSIPEIDVERLAVLLAESDPSLQLIDVRERNEVAIAQIKDFDVYPLSEFEQWAEQILTNLKPEAETIVMCHHGMRSAQLCQWLLVRGFTNVRNLAGGIDAYSRLVDSTINRY